MASTKAALTSALSLGLLLSYACSGERSEETGTEDAGQSGIDEDAGPGDGTPDGSDGDPDGSDGDPGDLDGGLDASPGDGDAGSGDGDAGASDGDAGSGDGDPADGTGLIVTVLVNGVPYEGQGVTLFDGADDAEPTTYRTNAQGRVAVETAQSIVTIAPIPDSVPVQAVGMPVTYFAVEEGDRLILNYPSPTSGVLGQYQITTAGASDGFSYQALAGNDCGAFIESPNTMFEIQAYGSCLDETDDVLSYAYDSGRLAGCAFAKDVARPADNTVAITLPAYAPLAQTELSLANYDGFEFVSSQLNQVSGKALYASETPSESDVTVTPVPYAYCAGFSDALEARLSFRDGSTTRTLRQRGAEADGFAFDYQTILPRVDFVTVIGNDDELSISTTAPVTNADMGLFIIGWDVFNGETTDFYPWLLIVPPDTTQLDLPQHPGGFDGVLRAAGGGFVDVGSQAGYTASKQEVIDASQTSEDGLQEFALTGASDTLRTTSLVTGIDTRIIRR